LEIESIKSKPF